MNGPFPIRWSRDAWETAYPLGERGWKPWPWEPPTRTKPMTGPEIWDAIQEMLRKPLRLWPTPFLPPAVVPWAEGAGVEPATVSPATR